jgi:hypothetical protein
MSDASSRFVASAVGSVIAETVTLPADVVKVRLQVQKASGTTVAQYTGFGNALSTIAREEGPRALWKGLCPALLRQVSYTSMSLVIYEPIRDFYKGLSSCGDNPNFAQRLAAGGTAGGLSISIFNPAEVIKTQVQTHRGSSSISMAEVASKVWRNDGIFGFWAGVKPNVARTFLVNAAELGTYDEAKSRIQPYLGDGFCTHVSASGCAAFTSACVSTPADVVKTRLMDSAGGEKKYSGMLNAGYRILLDEGPAALYKGFVPICVRKVFWVSSFFVTFENIRASLNK